MKDFTELKQKHRDTPEEVADLFIDRYGPTHRAYHSLTPEKAAAFRKDLIDLYRGYITPADGKVPGAGNTSLRLPGEHEYGSP
jgi:hypothetical protein